MMIKDNWNICHLVASCQPSWPWGGLHPFSPYDTVRYTIMKLCA